MKTIYKYTHPLFQSFTIAMPRGATILKIDVVKEAPVLWALVDIDEPEVTRYFRLVSTGQELNDYHRYSWVYVGTYLISEFVFHLWEVCV